MNRKIQSGDRESSICVQFATSRRGVPSANSFRRWAEAVIGNARGELVIRVVGIREGRLLNATYRHKDYATNVLSFPAGQIPGDVAAVLGDLVITSPIVLKESMEQRKVLREHWAHLVVHGCLHLMGYDHQEVSDANAMEAKEREILSSFGFGDPYA